MKLSGSIATAAGLFGLCLATASASLMNLVLSSEGDTGAGWLFNFGSERAAPPVPSIASQDLTRWFEGEMLFSASTSAPILSFMSVGGPSGLPPLPMPAGMPAPKAAQLPEPGNMALVGAGLFGLGVSRSWKSIFKTITGATA